MQNTKVKNTELTHANTEVKHANTETQNATTEGQNATTVPPDPQYMNTKQKP
jgi:hypothetical protein